LTGGIGSGKSLVGGMLRAKGFVVIDMDSIVSSLYEDEAVRKRVIELFGSLDRGEIASQVFAQPGKKEALEQLLHPRALTELRKRLLGIKSQELVFVEVPLLFEAGLEREFDAVVSIFAPREKRLERLVRRGMPRKDALKRMHFQLPEREKVKKADFAIDNRGSVEETARQVELVLRKLTDG